MATREDIIIRIINKVLGSKEIEKQKKVMTGLNRATQSVTRTTQGLNAGFKRTTDVTGKINKAGKVQLRTTETISKFQDKGADATARLAAKQKFLRTWSDRLGVGANKVNKIMKQQGINIDQNNQVTDLAGRRFGNLNKTMTKGRSVAKGFQFEWLSVMFAGMALSRVMGGILKTQMQLWGITEMYGAMLMTLFIPVMETLTSILFPILEWFMNMSPEMQALIGWFLVFGAVIGFFLLIIGQVMLAVNGLALLFKATSMMIAKVMGAVILIIIGIGLVIVGIIQIVKNWGKDWTAVISGVIKVLAGLALIILGIAILIGSWPLAFIAAIILIIAGIVWLVLKIIKHWDKIKEVSLNALKAIGRWFKKWFWEKPKEWLSKLFDWIKGLWTKVTGVFAKGPTKIAGTIPSKQAGGFVPITGPYMLHRGEYVNPAGRAKGAGAGSEIIINTNYSINVSDKEEMEKIMRDNNLKLVEEVKRQIAI